LQRENGTKRRRDRSRSRSRSLSIVSDEDEEEFDSCNMTPTIDSLGELAEQGRLVGITNLPDMAIGDKHTLTSRQDSDVSLNRQVKLISKERYSAIYAVDFEYKEIIDNDNLQLGVQQILIWNWVWMRQIRTQPFQ
ncbi:unnamed protein product, partial [Adineta steineri]